jgi:hypothetical protein
MNMLSLSLIGFVALSPLADLARASTPEIENLIVEKDVFPPDNDEGTLPGETDEQEMQSTPPSRGLPQPRNKPSKSCPPQTPQKNQSQGNK